MRQKIASLVVQILKSVIHVQMVSSLTKSQERVQRAHNQGAKVAVKELISVTRATVATWTTTDAVWNFVKWQVALLAPRTRNIVPFAKVVTTLTNTPRNACVVKNLIARLALEISPSVMHVNQAST